MKMTFVRKLSFVLNTLLIFSIVFDPYNYLFHIKNIAFVLFLLSSLPFIECKYYYVPLVFLSVFFVSLSFGILTNQNLSNESTMSMLKSFLFLTYIFWMPCEYLKTSKVFYCVCFLLSILQIILFVVLIFFPESLMFFTLFLNKGEEATLLIGIRNYYGIELPMIFYKTCPLLVLPLGISVSNFLQKKTVKNFLHFAVFAFGFFISGTRADMLSCVTLIFATVLFYHFYYKREVFFTAVFSSAFLFVFLLAVVFLLTANDYSTNIKSGHLSSFMNMFGENPLKFLLIGNGPVSYMYTSARNEWVTLTELTYLELIKNFGLIQSLLVVGILFLPVFFICKNKSYERIQKFSLSLSYVAYLFICGTNPLLISSTGFTALAVAFSFGNGTAFKNLEQKKQVKYVSETKRLLFKSSFNGEEI